MKNPIDSDTLEASLAETEEACRSRSSETEDARSISKMQGIAGQPGEDAQVLEWEEELMQRGIGSNSKSRPPLGDQSSLKSDFPVVPPPEDLLQGLQTNIGQVEAKHLQNERELAKLQQESLLAAKAFADVLNKLESKIQIAQEVNKFKSVVISLISTLRATLPTTIETYSRLSVEVQNKNQRVEQETDSTRIELEFGAESQQRVAVILEELKMKRGETSDLLGNVSSVIAMLESFKTSYPDLYRQSFLEESVQEILLPFAFWELCSCARLESFTREGLSWFGRIDKETGRKVALKLVIPFCEQVISSWWEPLRVAEVDGVLELLSMVHTLPVSQPDVTHALWRLILQALQESGSSIISQAKSEDTDNLDRRSVMVVRLLNTIIKLEPAAAPNFTTELENVALSVAHSFASISTFDDHMKQHIHNLTKSSIPCIRHVGSRAADGLTR